MSCHDEMRRPEIDAAEGWSVGSTTIKRVRLLDGQPPVVDVVRHTGDVTGAVARMLSTGSSRRAVITGPFAPTHLAAPYVPEAMCLEAALERLGVEADAIVSLGGERFVVYALQSGRIRRTVSETRCGAGSGEFLVQQFARMGLDLETGQAAAEHGQRVKMASRCSVHAKSDATHKLNKGECTVADVARTLVEQMAEKVAELVAKADGPARRIVLCGGLASNRLLVRCAQEILPSSAVETLAESPYLEAFGAAHLANGADAAPVALAAIPGGEGAARNAPHRPPREAAGLVEVMTDAGREPIGDGMSLLLGIDAGSTTTKAALVDEATGRLVAGCYLRTHGNPVRAAKSCVAEMNRAVGAARVRISHVAVTGSGREVVSLAFKSCPTFNEILAHARAARAVLPEADTIFEVGGQDAKFISLRDGVPVDYAMNDGCSAGTGSFLEESAGSELGLEVGELGAFAARSERAFDFGERCAAFINSEIRIAMQQGTCREDVAAGLVYAVVKNYLAKVVGTRSVGKAIVLQGGVALNPAVGLAVASCTGSRVVIPPRPELMGCVGAALLMRDVAGRDAAERLDVSLGSFEGVTTGVKAPFVCKACDNLCTVQRITVEDRTVPFGGLCSRWDVARRDGAARPMGRNLVAERHDLMFREFAPAPPPTPIATVGLPAALTTHELYPFYAKLLTGLGLEVVLSRTDDLDLRTHAPKCYPLQILHGAVRDLLDRGVAWIFLPYVGELAAEGRYDSSYLCASSVTAPAVVRSFFAAEEARFLTPEINLSPRRMAATRQHVVALAARFGIAEERALEALAAALDHQARFRAECRRLGDELLASADGPVIALAGKPYLAYARGANLAIDRKIAAHGYPVVPAEMLPLDSAVASNSFHHTQDAASVAALAARDPRLYVCNLSCFSCIPDAIFHHRLVKELEGKPSCLLEIDSHTADAGVETRIGAFLEIMAERHRSRPERRPATAAWAPTHTVERRGSSHVVRATDGAEYRLDDPRLKHVFLWVGPEVASRVVEGLCGSIGWNTKAMGSTDEEIIRLARTVCSGRECLSFRNIVGKMVKHLAERDPSEITVFHVLEKESVCQNAIWYDALPILLEKMNARNVACTFPTLHNGYLGEGETMALFLAASFVVGDILHEAGSALRAVAADRAAAERELGEITSAVGRAAGRGLLALEAELRRCAKQLAAIPRSREIADTPKVLINGGISRVYSEPAIRAVLEDRGVIVKLGELAEFLYHFVVQVEVTRPAYHRGIVSPEEQFAWGTVIGAVVRGGGRAALRSLKARVECTTIDALIRRWRGIVGRSGLLFDRATPMKDLVFKAHHLVSHNTFTEATTALGRLLQTVEDGVFDGIVNLGSFCCAEVHLGEALAAPHLRTTDVAFASLAVEGVTLTADDIQTLETLAAQCWRRRTSGPEVAANATEWTPAGLRLAGGR